MTPAHPPVPYHISTLIPPSSKLVYITKTRGEINWTYQDPVHDSPPLPPHPILSAHSAYSVLAATMPTGLSDLPPEIHLRIASIVYSFSGPEYNAIFKALRAIPLWRDLSARYGFRNATGVRVIFDEGLGWFFPTTRIPSGRYIVDLKGVFDVNACGRCQCDKSLWLDGEQQQCYWCVED